MTREEALARQLAEDSGFDPDELGAEEDMFRFKDGVTAIPDAHFIRPIWTFYAYEAKQTLARVANLPASEDAHG